mmetsp:Transcript_20080/g.46793  ORF Transcript_20080/g.46793 Transcript_20080/m.46793 type:complete len:86 (+) Transcript_20080:299-556(+)|eukprot:CAMPEP_0178418260 /NCGR_PEP_ID=MMETSP0689_2-20121128/24996_1 /TAXON_ID=160604 /ORGANISM="Amphidinium massartii, Strain CS-259" /LENGTH=85 /DNA_ID=CAMNT_0020039647 /DNA_START=207 /DNA_END=464 /DNA_ORIENTATION=-
MKLEVEEDEASDWNEAFSFIPDLLDVGCFRDVLLGERSGISSPPAIAEDTEGGREDMTCELQSDDVALTGLFITIGTGDGGDRGL